jgi:hypothetical protein
MNVVSIVSDFTGPEEGVLAVEGLLKVDGADSVAFVGVVAMVAAEMGVAEIPGIVLSLEFEDGFSFESSFTGKTGSACLIVVRFFSASGPMKLKNMV